MLSYILNIFFLTWKEGKEKFKNAPFHEEIIKLPSLK